MAMRQRLSPKQVARAIGVSESSLKRWCDRGLIPFEKTAGGHRRMVMSDVVTFLRSGGYKVVEPDALQLPATVGCSGWSLTQALDRFVAALVTGNEDLCRRIVMDLFLAGRGMAVICDGIIAEGFQRVGEMWSCGEVEVYEERRACEITARMVHELRSFLEPPEGSAPIALGATLDGDPYTLAVSMAELVLRESGFRAQSLGHMLPFATLHTAIVEQRPRLLWLSVSAIRDVDGFTAELNRLFQCAVEHGAALVLGGRALNEELRRRLSYSAYCDTFQHLQSFARTLTAQPTSRDETALPRSTAASE